MLESIRKNRKGILLMLISSICVCVGQMLWKLSESESIWLLLGGFCCYGIGALVMIVAYKYGSLSVLQPMLSSLNQIEDGFISRSLSQKGLTLLLFNPTNRITTI